jgi:hypothetical protein
VSEQPVLLARHGYMLLDNVYMRRQGSAWNSRALLQVYEGRWFFWQQTVKLWMFNVTLQARSNLSALSRG